MKGLGARFVSGGIGFDLICGDLINNEIRIARDRCE